MAPGRKDCPDCAVLEGKCARHKNAYSRRNCLDCAAMPGRCEAHRRSGRNACKREACLKHQQNLDRQATEDNDDEDAMDVDSTVQPNVKLKLGVDIPLRYPLPPKPPTPFNHTIHNQACAVQKPVARASTTEAFQRYDLVIHNKAVHKPTSAAAHSDTATTTIPKQEEEEMQEKLPWKQINKPPFRGRQT